MSNEHNGDKAEQVAKLRYVVGRPVLSDIIARQNEALELLDKCQTRENWHKFLSVYKLAFPFTVQGLANRQYDALRNTVSVMDYYNLFEHKEWRNRLRRHMLDVAPSITDKMLPFTTENTATVVSTLEQPKHWKDD
ncbi:MAG: hypothetical protein ACOWW1_09700 [archaeon]